MEDFTRGSRDSSPKFSPDGRTLAFLRPDDGGRRQIWLIRVDGGEAWQLTHAAGNVADLAWAPDSSRLVFAADVDPDNDLAEDRGTDGLPRVSVARRIKYRYDGMGWRGDAHFHLFLLDVEGGGCHQVTDGDWDDLLPTWSPDGARIAFISSRRDDRDITGKSEAYVIPDDPTGAREPEKWSADLETVGALAWSPDGQRLVAAGSGEGHGLGLWQSWLYMLEPGREPLRLTDDSVRPTLGIPGISPTSEIRWLENGRILFLAEARGQSYLMETSAEGGDARRVAGGEMLASMLSLDKLGHTAVMSVNSPTSPANLVAVDVESGRISQLTDYNRAYLEEHPPARQEKFTIHRAGMEIECRLYFPPDFDETGKYPLVLEIHGGPQRSIL